MGSYSEVNNRTRRVVLEPEITRAFFSQPRAWHGDDVALVVETRDVPDGTELRAEIVEAHDLPPAGDDFVVPLPGPHAIVNNRCRIAHTIRWDAQTRGRPLRLRTTRFEFCARIRVERFGLTHLSSRIYVDLHRFRLSG